MPFQQPTPGRSAPPHSSPSQPAPTEIERRLAVLEFRVRERPAALSALIDSAKNEDREAQLLLGLALLRGVVVDPDFDLAIQLIRPLWRRPLKRIPQEEIANLIPPTDTACVVARLNAADRAPGAAIDFSRVRRRIESNLVSNERLGVAYRARYASRTGASEDPLPDIHVRIGNMIASNPGASIHAYWRQHGTLAGIVARGIGPKNASKIEDLLRELLTMRGGEASPEHSRFE